MGRSKEYGEKLREVTRDKILLAAIALFAEKGLMGTSAKDIAKAAEVSVGLMYHYYKTKEEMFDAIVYDVLDEVKHLRDRYKGEDIEADIKTMAQECISEMEKGLEFSQWVCILAQSTDFDKEWIAELAKSIPTDKAQFFVASMQGLCRLQLTLKDDFCIPTVNLLTSFLLEDKQNG